jgi:hypothetical protein
MGVSLTVYPLQTFSVGRWDREVTETAVSKIRYIHPRLTHRCPPLSSLRQRPHQIAFQALDRMLMLLSDGRQSDG